MKIIASLLSGSSMLMATPIWAQEMPAGDAKDAGTASSVGDIIVTAQRRGESLQRVPIAVSAVTAETLTNSGVSVQTALPRLVPNLQINQSATFISPYLRGVGTEFANAGLESSVAVYLDDAYLTRPSFSLASFVDINRVEVLKGPQGTLYGRNATGGLLRIITNDPVDRFEARAGATYGRFDRVALEGVVNIPFAPGIAGRFTASYDRNDGYEKNLDPNGPRYQSRNYFIGTGKLLFDLSDNFQVKVSGDYAYRNDREGQGWIALTNSAPGQTGILLGGQPSPGFYTTSQDYAGEGKGNKNEQIGGALRADLTLDGAIISAITTYRYVHELSYADLDTVDVPLLHAASSPVVAKTFSQELQAVSNGDGPLQWVAGLYYYREKSRHRFGIYGAGIDASFGLPSGPDVGAIDGGAALFSDGFIKTSSFAPYAQVTYALSPQFDLSLGARYTMEKKTLTGHEVSALGLGPAPLILLDEAPRSTKFNRFTPKATLSYKPDDDIMVYATYSKGFKSGGFNVVALSIADAVQPETLTDYEIGFKFRNDWLRLSSSAFYYDYRGLQVQYVDNSGASRTQNAANAEIYGFEIEGTVSVSRTFQINGGIGYLHSRYKDYIGNAYVLTPAGFITELQDLSGNRLTQSPKLTASISSDYKHQLASGATIGLSSGLAFTSPYYFDSGNQYREPGRVLVNLNLSWTSASQKLRFDLFGDNLLGEKYRYTVTPSTNGGFYIPAPPMTWGVKGTVSF